MSRRYSDPFSHNDSSVEGDGYGSFKMRPPSSPFDRHPQVDIWARDKIDDGASERNFHFAMQAARRRINTIRGLEDSRLERSVHEKFRLMKAESNAAETKTNGKAGAPSRPDDLVNQDKTTEEPDIITLEQLIQIFPRANKEVLRQVLVQLQAHMREYGITNAVQLAHFLAQAGAETGGFVQGIHVENLNYSATRLPQVWPNRFGPGKKNPTDYASKPVELGNYVYGNRLGNGPESSGDGYLYRGRNSSTNR